jgi:hypothetical protein
LTLVPVSTRLILSTGCLLLISCNLSIRSSAYLLYEWHQASVLHVMQYRCLTSLVKRAGINNVVKTR